ncbi:MAG: GHMP kinase [Candidatus Aenigmarchaeota archaeon]|nr:GHMP kinase [Candidatus Aenigmarchaeota archaeon]
MIISKTPFRISFCGGGTDLKEYYSKRQGSVVSTAIDRYMYITVKDFFERDKIFLKYSRTELVKNVERIKHPIIREALKLTGILRGIEISSMADIPSATGLGSSSAFTVGLLNALHAYLDEHKSPEKLAKEACRIEIEILKEPIGKQDQYISAYGGLRHILFNYDGGVSSEIIMIPRGLREELENNLLLFYTGIKRKSRDILSEQKKKSSKNIEILDKMRDLSFELKESLMKKDITRFGELLHKNWEYKKRLASGITNPLIDRHYNLALKSGALGGKVLGAGGGGFLLFYCEQKRQNLLIKNLESLRHVPFRFENHGTRTVYRDD